MCWQHARLQLHLAVKDSAIAGAGRGLFAYAPTKAQRDAHVILWHDGDFISPLNGRTTSAAELTAHYGAHTAPYGAPSSVANTGRPFVDGLGHRYIGHYSNTKLGAPLADGRRHSVLAGTNAELSGFRADGHIWLRATRAIRSGDEILTYYGRDYLMEPHARVQ